MVTPTPGGAGEGARPASAGRAPGASPSPDTDPDGLADPSGTPLLRLRGISKHFGPVQALTDINLDIPVGQVTALVGDNGAGKSTLIKCIAGIWEPTSGELLWNGKPVHVRTPAGRRPNSGSPPSTRIWPCATTWTSCRTCSSATSRCGTGCWMRSRWRRPRRPRSPTWRSPRVRSVRQPVGLAVGRPAAVGRGGQGGHAGRPARDHGRADRRARREPDRTGAEPDHPAGRTRPCALS